jgi:hypothetical protein
MNSKEGGLNLIMRLRGGRSRHKIREKPAYFVSLRGGGGGCGEASNSLPGYFVEGPKYTKWTRPPEGQTSYREVEISANI